MLESLIVKKFGGTSVGSLERIEAVAEKIACEPKARGEETVNPQVLVASAMAGETNRLTKLADDLAPNYQGPARDMLLASGEQVSIALLAMALEKRGVRAKPYLAHQIGIFTDSMYSVARIQKIDTNQLFKDLSAGVIPIVAGFQGVDSMANITTLGRGGSDTTAMAIAAALKSPVCEIYTDVTGVFTADPRLVPKAKKLNRISFEGMLEMASLGSKVLHVRSVEMASKFGVQIHVRSSFNNEEGTRVVGEEECMENPLVSGVTHEVETGVIKIYPFPDGSESLAKVFEKLTADGIVVDIISQSILDSGQRLAFSVARKDLNKAKTAVEKELGGTLNFEIMDQVSKVSIVGVGMRNHPGVAAKFFRVLADTEIPIHLVTTSEIKVSAVIDQTQLEKAAQALHTAFDLDS